jgi:predicted aminopeptidase
VAYVVSAAPKDDLVPYLWRFPIVGSFPYKGFFRIEDARKQRNILESEGYDAFLSGAAAFSALGWFSDPLYSSMLEMDQIQLVYTILHEMVHGTVYFPSHADFNEQLATFVGWNGALAFTRFTYGRDSMQVRHAEAVIRDEKTLADFITWAHARLSLFYALPIPREDKISGRKRVFDEIRDEFELYLTKFGSERFSALKAIPWNNASILSLWRYRYDTGHLEDLYAHVGSDPNALMALVKTWRENRVDPQKALTEALAGKDASDAFGSQKALAAI